MTDVKQPQDIFFNLRNLALTLSPEVAKITAVPGVPYGIVMETGYGNATVTLVSLADGTASLYFSTGGGFIGAGRQKSVSDASIKFVSDAARFVASMQRTAEFPLPKVGEIVFYAMTDGAIFTYAAVESDLARKVDALWPPLLQRTQRDH